MMMEVSKVLLNFLYEEKKMKINVNCVVNLGFSLS